MTLNNPIVYTCFCTDIIHEGHLNLIKEAKKYGDVIVGVLCDSEMVKYNQFPLKSTEQRMEIVKNISGIKDVVVQNEIMYDNIIKEIRPDYVIHGNNWEEDSMKLIRKNIIEVTSRYGGELIEIPYTFNEHVQKIDKQMKEKLAMPELRRARLKRLLDIVPIVKTIEVHSGLTGLIAEKTVLADGEVIDQFEAMWVSSLCDSTEKGKPDIELVDMTSRFRTINDIMEVTTKPIIFDGDTGGIAEHFVYTVRSLERMGVSAIIIEDKVGLKKNSLFGTDVEQTQDDIEHFCEKIAAGKKAQISDDFMIIARIESLILEKGMDDALKRAFAFRDAGADGIMIHSRKKDPSEILEFCDKFRDEDQKTPIVVVPSSFNSITESELKKHGVNIVIYANQLLRAAFPAMQDAAKSILKHHRAEEIDNKLMSIKDIITLIDEI
ncbi:phosphoenolpyruvate mutase [Methanobrevibacter oralis]|uniref:phosphoenolpyruvate mutase n=1 Tax=Methanobrevibacter oralis TaxID=66851 RepID=A0A166C955_METOA|nr:phosphoenolpyruvate mutase [Methanobrevibacter oralis]KZX14261.1 phosphonopyruvate hydrolase [Methanobrevibacter oralis]